MNDEEFADVVEMAHNGLSPEARVFAQGVLVGALYRARAVLRELVDALPRCDHCHAPATRAHGRGGARYCDEHAPAGCPPYPRAEPLRRALAALGRERPMGPVVTLGGGVLGIDMGKAKEGDG
jgi:hypothetical protein